jgi:hypothetical protein
VAVLGVLAGASPAGRLASLSSGLAAIAVGVLAVAVVLRWPVLVAWAIAVAGAAFVVGRPGVGAGDAVAGCGLLLAAELAYWSIEHDRRIRVERVVTVRRALALAALMLAAVAADLLLVSATALAAPGGVLLAALGAAAAVATLALVLRLARPA